MRKVYNFKKLTEKVMNVAVLLLMLVMTAGTLFAEEVTIVFSEAGLVNTQVLPDGDINGIIMYSGDQQGAATDGPKYYSSGSALRFYNGSGNTLGNALILTPAFGYQITGLTINGVANYTPVVGYVVDGGETMMVNADDQVYTISDIEATTSLRFYNAGDFQLRVSSITISYTTADVPAVATPTFNPQPGICTLPTNVSLSCATPGAIIYYTLNDGEYYASYESEIALDTTTTIHAFAVLGEDTSDIVNATYVFPQNVNLNGFKNGVPGGLYMIQNANEKMDFVFRNGRNIYFMSEQLGSSRGLLVYDNSNPVVTTSFEEGESVDMLMGTLAFYNGIPEMIPVANPGLAAGSAPHTVAPVQVTVAELLANPEMYISSLVIIKDGQFQAGAFNTSTKTGVQFTQGTDAIVVYNNFKTVSATFEGGEKASVVGLVGMYNGVPQIYPRGNSDIIRVALPYVCDFEGGAALEWNFKNATKNKWFIHNAQGFDNKKMFVSSTTGFTNMYDATISAVSHAYLNVTLPESDMLLNFDCRVVGNGNDFLQVSVLDEAPADMVLPETYLARYHGINEFTNQTVLIPSSYAGKKVIVFTWINDNSVGNQTPAAIDNITLRTTCTMVSNVTATVDNRTAVVTWVAPEGQEAWTLQYKAVDADAWQSVNTTSTSVTLNNLATETSYDLRVRANCEAEASAWNTVQFTVPCIDMTSEEMEVSIGTGTSSSYNAPMNAYYGNSWTQMIYPASNFSTSGFINSLSWQTANATSHAYTSLKIYLGTTTMSGHSSSSDWLSMDDLTLVYENNNGTIGGATGWETYILNNPYYYDAEDNLVVVVSRAAPSWATVNYYYTSTPNAVLYRRADGNSSYAEHPGSAIGSQLNQLPNMRVDYLGYVCGDDHCAAPEEVLVNNITTNSAALLWEPGEASSWRVSYKGENEEDWTSFSVGTNFCQLTNLAQNTNYEVRVMADCGNIGRSAEASVAFTTVADCPAPTNLTVTHNLNNTIVSWTPVAGVNSYVLQYSHVNSGMWQNVNVNYASTFVLGGLTEGESYIVRVKSVCDAETELESSWATCTFVRPVYCDVPTQFTVSEITSTSAKIAWDTLSANSWTVQYGEAGFELGHGTVLTVSAPVATISGLTPHTTYDVYVRPNCAGFLGAWSSVYSFTTACDGITITEANPWFEDFEGYHGSGAIGVGDCWSAPVTANASNGVFPSVYVGYSGSTYSGANSMEFKGASNLLVLPLFTNAMNTLQFTFWANTTAYSDYSAGTMEVGIITDITDPTTFTVVENIPPTAFNRVGQDAPHANFVGPVSFANVTPAPGQRIAMRYSNPSYTTQSWNLDDFTVSIIQDCPVPGNVAASEITDSTAKITWTPNGEETQWQLQYGVEGFVLGLGNTVNVTTNQYVLTNLSEGTSYDVYVKAVCDENTSSVWFGPYTFETTTTAIEPQPLCEDGCQYTFVLTDTYGSGWTDINYATGETVVGSLVIKQNDIVVSSLTMTEEDGETVTYQVSLCDSMPTTFILTPSYWGDEMGVAVYDPNGELVWLFEENTFEGFGDDDPVEFNFTAVCPEIINCVNPENLVLTALTDSTATLAWTGDPTVTYVVYYGPASQVVQYTDTVTATEITLTGLTSGVTYMACVRALCNNTDVISNVVVFYPTQFTTKDIALSEIKPISNACDLTNIPVTITVQNAGEGEFNIFEAYYMVNSGNVVHETITLIAPLAANEAMTYTFVTKANLTESSNVVTAWVELPGDGNSMNNMLTTNPVIILDPASVPFVETFEAEEIHDGWVNVDNQFLIAGGKLVALPKAEVDAQSRLISPCMYIPAGHYDVSYSYNAVDSMFTEKMDVYFGTKENGEYDMTLLASEEFSNQNVNTAHYTLEVAESGIYYFQINSSSIYGTAGFVVDNFAVKNMINFTVYAGENGTVVPEGAVEYVAGEPYTFAIIPDPGYHVMGIYRNMQLVSGENANNAGVQYFTFTPQNNDNIYVTFTSSHFEVNATVANLHYTDFNENAIGAVYTPNHATVNYGASHSGLITLAAHYHVYSVTVNGLDVTESLVPVNEHQYMLTIDNIVEDKNIHVVAGLDSTTIVYTVLAGQGTINNDIVVDATTELPAVYTVTLPGYSDLLSTITPAPGYHVSSIIVDGVEHNIIDMYSFEHLFGYHTVTVVFSKNHYTITTVAYGNGTVSEGAEFEYDPNYVYDFIATPAEGYRIASILRNNVEIPVANPAVTYTESLTNITTDYVYEVHFAQNTFTVTAASGAHGTVSPVGVTYYLYHQDAVYEINAEQGYYIASVTIDGETSNFTQADALTSYTTTFSQISEDHTISATFAQMIFTVTANPVTNGNITIPGNGTYPYGATPTCVITPNEGYLISDVTVDGESVGAVSSYTFTPLASNHTIGATFSAALFTITATAGNGGNITPAGVTNMAYNGSQAYTISANAGYHISDVYVDGVSVGAVASYTFNNVTANHSIYAAFEANEYTITVNQPANGVITPGTTTVASGATPTFVFTPALGYAVTAITVNGTNVIANATNLNDIYTYVFPAVNANQTLTATMTAKSFTINATAGANGSITPSGSTTVYYGNTQSYNITPANGYVVDNVVVDGMSVGALTSYIFTNVVANHTISVTFKLADCDIPTFLYTSHIDSTSAELHWSHPTATSFDIQYKTPTGTMTAVSAIAGTSYLLTDLTPNTTYLWQVRANCSSVNHSEWSNMVSFTTESTTIDETGIEDLVKSSIKVYAEHQNVHILNNEGLNIDNVRIFDAYGKLIYNGTVNTTHEVIGLTVAAGTYIVNVTTDKGVANYKVVIMK